MLQYEMFQLKAAQCYQPAGNNIFCTCYTEIEVGSSSSSSTAAVTKGTEVQGGLWWSRRSKADKKSPSAKKKPTQRRRVTCPNTECGVSCVKVFTSGNKFTCFV